MAKSKALTVDRFSGNFIVDRGLNAINKEGDIFCFDAMIKDDYDFEVSDNIIFHDGCYEVIEIKGKKKNLTTFYAKRLRHNG